MARGSLSGVVDSFGEVLVQHLRLLRLELADDARYFGVRVAIIAGLAPLVLVGYGFLCAAAAVALQRLMSLELALVVIGAFNLVGGVLGIVKAAEGLAARQPLQQTLVELEHTTALIPGRGERAP